MRCWGWSSPATRTSRTSSSPRIGTTSLLSERTTYHPGDERMTVESEYNPDADRIMSVALGPQHPGAGHFRIQLWLDGDYVVKAEPDPGYVHRGEEKMSEYRNYIQNVPHLERPVILDSCGILFPYALAVDELMKTINPRRSKYVRVIASELNRCIYTLYWLAIYGIFLGHSTMFMRSEEHTSELQSQSNLVCRLLLEKKKKKTKTIPNNKNTTIIHTKGD